MIWFTDKVHQVHWNYKQHHHSYHQIHEFASRSFEKNHTMMAWYKLKPLLKAANCTSGWEKESYMPAMQLFKAKLFETLYSHKECCKQSTLSNLEEAWGRFRIGHHLYQPQKHQWICAKDGFWVCWAWSTSVLGPPAQKASCTFWSPFFVRMTELAWNKLRLSWIRLNAFTSGKRVGGLRQQWRHLDFTIWEKRTEQTEHGTEQQTQQIGWLSQLSHQNLKSVAAPS